MYMQADPDGYGTLNGYFTTKQQTALELEEYSTFNQPQLHKSLYVGHKPTTSQSVNILYIKVRVTTIMPVSCIAVTQPR